MKNVDVNYVQRFFFTSLIKQNRLEKMSATNADIICGGPRLSTYH